MLSALVRELAMHSLPSGSRGNKPYFGKYALQILEEAE